MGTKENGSACCWDDLHRSKCFHIRQMQQCPPYGAPYPDSLWLEEGPRQRQWSNKSPLKQASSTSTTRPAGAFSSVCFCVFICYVGQLLLAGVGVLRLPTLLTWVFPSCNRKLSGWLWSAWQHNKTRKEKSVWTDKCRWELVLHGPVTIITRLSLLVLIVDWKFYSQTD